MHGFRSSVPIAGCAVDLAVVPGHVGRVEHLAAGGAEEAGLVPALVDGLPLLRGVDALLVGGAETGHLEAETVSVDGAH